jgi:hypothetical protein
MEVSMTTFHVCRLAGSKVLPFALLVMIVATGCVSVQKSGQGESAPPPPPPELANVMLDSDQRAAEVYVNGEFRGTAPLNLNLPAGTHTIEFKLRGYQTWKRELVVVGGNDTRVAARMQQE